MFGLKTAKDKPRERDRGERRRSDHLSQFGLMDVPGLDAMGNLEDMLEDNDADLEAELAQLVNDGARKPRPKAKPVPNLDLMVADCLKDYDSSEDLSDTEDPDLLAELNGLDDERAEEEPELLALQQQQQPVYAGDSYLSIIQNRIVAYREAEEIAKHNGETSKERRFNRGLKTLKELESAIKAGKPVSEDDIPPQINVGKRRELENTVTEAIAPPPVPERRSAPPPPLVQPITTPSLPIDTPPPLANSGSHLTAIEERKKELKQRALAAKGMGDKASAMEFMKRIKLCDQLLDSVRAGHSVEMSALPGLTLTVTTTAVGRTPPADSLPAIVDTSSATAGGATGLSEDDPVLVPQAGDLIPPPNPEILGGPPVPASMKEALTQRLDKYKAEEAKAKAEGNSSKARRMGRIVKQYQEALALHAAGRPIPRADLPDPPGFAPIPLGNTPASSPLLVAAGHPAAARDGSSAVPSADASPVSIPKSTAVQADTTVKKVAPPVPPQQAGGKVQRQTSVFSVQDKQLLALEKTQKLFKEAALTAKQQGQRDMAREYLKHVLSLNKLIEVSRAGLPVDMTTLPVPPQMQVKTNMDFEIVSKEDCQVSGDREEMFSKLEQDLIAQVKMCMSNRTHFKEVGDISSANKFEQMAVHSKKDLDSVRFAYKRGDSVPKFHYETRAFSRVVSFTELTDNDLELTVMAGINYVVKNPKDVDTYVKWEFPFPKETPVIDKTAVVKDTNNPEYDSKFLLVINPRDKTFQRVVKRSALKVEVWSKGGFLRSDTLIGTATVRLSSLETQCEIHDSFDLYDGRKPAGGKVEVRLRLRNPVVSKQLEQAQEKWLVVQF